MRKPNLLRLLFCVSLGIAVTTARAHSPHDHIEGLVLSPEFAKDRTVFVTARGSLLRSTEGGENWHRVVRGLDNREEFTCLAVAPRSGAGYVVYAGTIGDGIYKSEDNGHTFAKANSGLSTRSINAMFTHGAFVYASSKTKGLFRATIGAEEWKLVLAVGGPIMALAADPVNPQLLYAGDANGALHRSEDGGMTWAKLAQLVDKAPIYALLARPGGKIFADVHGKGLLQSTDGKTFVEVSAVPDKAVIYLHAVPKASGGATLYASSWFKGVFRSDDEGVTWTLGSQGLSGHEQADQRGLPYYFEIRTPENVPNPPLFLAGYNGLFQSVDNGATWNEKETLPYSLLIDLAVSPDAGGAHAVLSSTYWRGAFMAQNGDEPWAPICASLALPPWKRDGRRIARLHSVAFSPGYATDHTIFAGLRDQLLVTRNRGGSWDSVNLHSLLGDQELILDRIALSPSWGTDRTMFVGGRAGRGDTRHAALIKSTDGGRTFEVVLEDEGEYVQSMAISPNFPVDHTVFASTAWDKGGRIFRSVDAGKTWQRTDAGVEYHTDGADVVPSPAYAKDRTVFAATGAGLYQSTDGGTTWQAIRAPVFGEDPNAETLAVSPAFEKDRTLLVSIKGRGLFKSADAGASFVEFAPQLFADNVALSKIWYYSPGNTIVFSPTYAKDRTLYGSTGYTFLRSKDAGATWETLPVRQHAELPFEEISLATGITVGAVVLAAVTFVVVSLRRRLRGSKPRSV
ncbi:MAG: WD40/YVTN/BNR-like repeat-containing protein [Roseimicrobium sp.]